MQKKILLILGLVAILGVTTSEVMAHSTIYTDDLGRMHFLGKDNGAKTLQKVEDYDNPAQQDVTNATLNNIESQKADDVKLRPVSKVDKTKGSFSAQKGSMDASNPYTYGGTNIGNSKIEDNPAKKHFWRIW